MFTSKSRDTTREIERRKGELVCKLAVGEIFICSKTTAKSFGDGSQDSFKDSDVRVFQWLWATVTSFVDSSNEARFQVGPGSKSTNPSSPSETRGGWM